MKPDHKGGEVKLKPGRIDETKLPQRMCHDKTGSQRG